MRAFARFFQVVAIYAAAVCVNHALAAEFSVGPSGFGISIEGEIKQGDFNRFFQFYFDANVIKKNKKVNSFNVFLDSPGGSVEEALKFANLLRENFSSVWIMQGKRCFSACTIIWAGGVERTLYGDAKLGFHRLSFSKKEVDVRKSKAKTDLESQKVTDYFREVGLPAVLIDKMNETPPSDLYIVDMRWLLEHELDKAVAYQPAFLDVVEKHCGVDPTMPAYKQARLPTSVEMASLKTWMTCADEVKDANREITVKTYEKGYKRQDSNSRR